MISYWEKTMSLLDVARTRYTTKHYDPAKRVSDADFADLLEVLRLAPTSVNAQATRYFVADNDAAKEKILPAILDFNRRCCSEALGRLGRKRFCPRFLTSTVRVSPNRATRSSLR